MSSKTEAWTLQDKLVLVTGSSRGIGAAVVERMAAQGSDVAINYRSKRARAEEVAKTVHAVGRKALLVQADLTVADDVSEMVRQVQSEWGHIDLLVLNASGGLERDKEADYAMQINLYAQLRLVDALLPLFAPGGRLIYVTSHMAHFYGESPLWPDYEPVAASKKACEDALLARIREFEALGLKLLIVSGDIIEGTITPKLLDRKSRGIIDARQRQVGSIPTVEEFADAIVELAADPDIASGTIKFVGSTANYPIAD